MLGAQKVNACYRYCYHYTWSTLQLNFEILTVYLLVLKVAYLQAACRAQYWLLSPIKLLRSCHFSSRSMACKLEEESTVLSEVADGARELDACRLWLTRDLLRSRGSFSEVILWDCACMRKGRKSIVVHRGRHYSPKAFFNLDWASKG